MSEEASPPKATNEASEPLLNNNNNNAAKIKSKIVQAQQKRKKSPSNSKLLRSLGEKELKLRQRTVALLVREWHKEHNSCAPLTIKELYQKLYDRYGDVDDEQSVRQNTINDKYLCMTVELAGVGKILSYGFMLLKAEPLSNLPNLLHALLPSNPLYCVGRHCVFQGHGGKELTSADCQPQGTCGDVLTSGDVLVILPGQNSKCMVYTFYVSRAVQLGAE